MNKRSKASVMLEDIAKSSGDKKNDSVSFAEIKEILQERGFAIMLIFFALPLCLPIPTPPGLTTIMSMPLLLFSAQMMMGKSTLWIPKFLAKRSIKRSTIAVIVEKSSPFLKKIETITKPRIKIFNSKFGEKVVGFFMFLCSVSIAIPLPLTNFIPATGIVVAGLGLLSFDGIAILIGMIIGFTGLGLTTLIIIFGEKIVRGFISLVF